MLEKQHLFQAFGMTETTGGHTLNNEKNFRLEATGRKREGIHAKIIHPDEDGQGEVTQFSTKSVLYEGGGDVIFLPIWGYCYCN